MKATLVLERHHQRLGQLLGALEGERFARGALLLDLSEEAAAHFEAERQQVYTGLESRLEGARTFAQSAGRVTTRLRELGELLDQPERFTEKLSELRQAMDAHTSLERDSLLPELETTLTAAELEALGAALEASHAEVLRRCRTAIAASPSSTTLLAGGPRDTRGRALPDPSVRRRAMIARR